MKPGPHLIVFSLAALAPALRAGVITGRVVDSQGIGVPGVNIEVQGSGGPIISNGGTGPGGFFTATITPDGIYDLVFEPPPPPATTHLVEVLPSINVTGTVNLGDVSLPPGVALTGRTIRAVGGSAVPGVNLDVVANGADLHLVGDTTNALGQFSIAVPTGPIEVRFRTDGTAPPLLAPHKLELSLSTSANIGDVPLQPGFFLSAIVKRLSNGNAVVNADIDVSDSITGFKLFTPSDNTDSAGFVDVVVPTGTYDFEVCPQFADKLVAKTLLSQVVTANTFLGTHLLSNGVVLSGKVVDYLGNVHAQVDVDLHDSTTGASVTLCADNTDGNGNYAVVVPTGVFDVQFDPPAFLGLGSQTILDVVINGDETLNGTLPACVVVYCTSKPSSVPGCVPSIAPPCEASLSGGPGSADVVCGPVPGGSQPGILVYTTQGPAASPVINAYGFLCIKTGPGFVRVLPAKVPGGTTGTCSGSHVFDFGTYLAGPNADPNLVPGATIDTQAWYRDPPNPGGANLSNAATFHLVP